MLVYKKLSVMKFSIKYILKSNIVNFENIDISHHDVVYLT